MKIKAFLLATILQVFFALVFFVGSLLDPLLGLCVVGFYFFVVGYFLAYQFVLSKTTVSNLTAPQNNIKS